MVEQFKSFKANEKQQTYLSTIFAVISGTMMHTAWQFIVPTELEMPAMNLFIIPTLILFSLASAAVGYNILTKEDQ